MADFSLPPVRIALYVCLLVFSVVVLGLTSARLNYTLNVPEFDPVNNGEDFYDPVVVELLVTSILTFLWSLYAIFILVRRAEPRILYTFRGELMALFVLWVMWVVGAGVASPIDAIVVHNADVPQGPWGDLAWCWIYEPCRILTAMLAFCWCTWIILTLISILSILFVTVNKALTQPMHGRWDPTFTRDSGVQHQIPPMSHV
ncbi:hypothetical protein CYLTODRAFT_362191 [Cylindrobasidium torrendii FP15055 ss-10]|uniref:MARVEL domain-containing protein n=1 Tax=Cylindrobasidium torrendii FP15055 ss-10 TaxID=1314674 RepID=A0A0D7AVA1_9AGAR|nr:hypothetical protein CYLTODRAFT_362191 [Cylindrobasidium torrendii FP15055 ss-10]